MSTKKPTTTTPKKRPSGRSAKAKGNRGEKEIVDALTDLGVPTQKVVGSGAFKGKAEADCKVGITFNEDGTIPDADESRCVLRGEVKNRKTNPDYHPNDSQEVVAFTSIGKNAVEQLWKDLNQASITKVVLLKRAKIAPGTLSNKKYNDAYGVFMGLETFAELLRKAYPHLEQQQSEIPKDKK